MEPYQDCPSSSVPQKLHLLPQMGRGVEEDRMQVECGNVVTLGEPDQLAARIWVIQ